MVEITRVLRPNGLFISLRTDPFRYGPEDPSAIRHFRDAYNQAIKIKRHTVGATNDDIVDKYSGEFGDFCRALYGLARSETGKKQWGLKVVEEETIEIPIGTWHCKWPISTASTVHPFLTSDLPISESVSADVGEPEQGQYHTYI